MAAVQLSDAQFNQLLEKLKGAGGGAAGVDGNGGSSTTDSTSKSAKPPSRPIVDIDTTDGEWAIFDDQWSAVFSIVTNYMSILSCFISS